MESAGGWSTDEVQEQRRDMHPVLKEPKHRPDPSEVDEQQRTAFSTEVDIGWQQWWFREASSQWQHASLDQDQVNRSVKCIRWFLPDPNVIETDRLANSLVDRIVFGRLWIAVVVAVARWSRSDLLSSPHSSNNRSLLWRPERNAMRVVEPLGLAYECGDLLASILISRRARRWHVMWPNSMDCLSVYQDTWTERCPCKRRGELEPYPRSLPCERQWPEVHERIHRHAMVPRTCCTRSRRWPIRARYDRYHHLSAEN